MIAYKDTCKLVDVTSNAYGDKNISDETEIPCLFLQSTGNSRSTNVEIAESDAHIYLDPEHPAIKDIGYRIEGKHLIVNTLGSDESNNWYKVSRVVIGQRKLLENNVDNVHAYLRRVAPLQG